jgi:hypothetical protein
MNCSDISLILDDGDTRTLADEPRKAVDAHLAECDDCARDWKLHARLAEKKFPALPSDLVEEFGILAATSPGTTPPRRKWNRVALVVGVAVLAAAAAMLVLYRAAGSHTAEVPPAPAAHIDQQDSNVAVNTLASGTSQDFPRAQVKTPPVAHDAGDALSVRVSTSPDETLNAADLSDFNVFRTAAIDELRRTPGLTLVLAESSPSRQTVDFEITLSAVRRSDQLMARVDIGKSAPNSPVLPLRAAFGQGAANLGQSMSRTAVMLMTPLPPAQRPALLKNLLDVSLPPQQRLEALRVLDQRNLGFRRGGLRTDPSGDSLRDPAIIRAVIDLASVAADPDQRAEIWKTMRSITSPALIEPLTRAAQLDPDTRVRAEAIATLVADYVRDSHARAALQLVARTDSDSTLRALAMRGLSGEATWRSYVVSSLEDTTLPDAQRLDAVLFHARNSDVSRQPLAGLLDGDAIKALAEVLPRAGSTGSDTYGVSLLLNHRTTRSSIRPQTGHQHARRPRGGTWSPCGAGEDRTS